MRHLGFNFNKKCKNYEITKEFLLFRSNRCISQGYKKQKWIEFCEVLLSHGFYLSLYEAKETVSKYITIRKYNRKYVVRFSNHKPNLNRELRGDCDFFVGMTHTGIRTTDQALKAVYNYFEDWKNCHQEKSLMNDDYYKLLTKQQLSE